MTERKALTGGDWLAIGTFLLGTLATVLMAMALWRGVADAQGTGALAWAIARAIGPWPALIGGVGLAWLGGRHFLGRGGVPIVRGALGILGVAVGFSILAGSFSPDAGGTFGARTGGAVSSLSHGVVGALLGMAVALAAIWHGWMRTAEDAPAKVATSRKTTSAPPRVDEGVTAAESAMLFPAESVSAPKPIPAAPAARLRPLYPEDVRLKGELPSGTKPLDPASVPQARSAAAAAPAHEAEAEAEAEDTQPAVYRWTAPRGEPVADEEPATVEEAELVAEVEVEPVADAMQDEDVKPMPPRPSWETTGLTEEDEPVDAYGTPISVIEKVLGEREVTEADATEQDSAGAMVVEERASAAVPREIDAAADEEELAVEELAADVPVTALQETDAGAEMDEDLVAEDEEEYEEYEEETEDEEADEEVYAESEEELDEESDEDRAEELEEEPAEVVATVDTEAGEDEDEADASEDVEPEPIAEDELVPQARTQPAAPPEPAPEPVAEAVPATKARASKSSAPASSRSSGPGLFDADEGAPAEREVVLQPQEAAPAARAEKSLPRGLDPNHKLLAEVGCMFVERGRVAVSMLQKQYEMDFDQACQVLDDLQEMGLIGPYLGGQRRDILLSREEWLEKVASA